MKKYFYIIMMLIISVFSTNVYAEDQAKINDTTYATISEAINNAQTDDTIIILSNINGIDIPQGKKITIDLNNNEITKLTNDGELTLKGTGKIYNESSFGLKNTATGNLTIENVTFESRSGVSRTFNNSGVANIKSATFQASNDVTHPEYINNNSTGVITINDGNYKGYILFNNEGKFIINGGTFETTNNLSSNGNLSGGTLTINDGVFKSEKKEFVYNSRGTVNINGGEFQCKTVATNYDPNYLNNSDKKKSIINVNDGVFNVTSTAFSNSALSDYSILNINGGTITLSEEDQYVIGEYGSGNNEIHITGGVINAQNSSGLKLYAPAKFIIGKDDDNVTSDSPIINIKDGLVFGLGNPTVEFYDGKINLKNKIDISTLIPGGYYIQYDTKSDGSLLAYLKKSNDDVPNQNTPEKENEVTKTEEKDEKIENPKTGIESYTYVILLAIVAIVASVLMNKKSLFRRI